MKPLEILGFKCKFPVWNYKVVNLSWSIFTQFLIIFNNQKRYCEKFVNFRLNSSKNILQNLSWNSYNYFYLIIVFWNFLSVHEKIQLIIDRHKVMDELILKYHKHKNIFNVLYILKISSWQSRAAHDREDVSSRQVTDIVVIIEIIHWHASWRSATRLRSNFQEIIHFCAIDATVSLEILFDSSALM